MNALVSFVKQLVKVWHVMMDDLRHSMLLATSHSFIHSSTFVDESGNDDDVTMLYRWQFWESLIKADRENLITKDIAFATFSSSSELMAAKWAQSHGDVRTFISTPNSQVTIKH
jgi:hypothetical protein